MQREQEEGMILKTCGRLLKYLMMGKWPRLQKGLVEQVGIALWLLHHHVQE
jgi:hypothetical protein